MTIPHYSLSCSSIHEFYCHSLCHFYSGPSFHFIFSHCDHNIFFCMIFTFVTLYIHVYQNDIDVSQLFF